MTNKGLVKSNHLIIATNAYTDKNIPWLRKKLIPVISEMISTLEIGNNRVNSLMPKLTTFGEALNLFYYFRPSPDGKRILIGGRRVRYNNENPFSSLDGVMHETGHALYELNLPKDWMHQPAGKSRGMAMHESQSLLIEMQITRSLAFKKFLSNTLNKKFNIKDKATNPDNLYKLGTRVNKSFIRVESDEVTYPLHIILRFNLERKIFNNEINIADIPDAWNDEFNRLFNLSINKDTDGCLQDIHWFAGLFGYFPTYSLGALTAAQFASQLRTDQKELDKEIENGEFSNLVNWLKKNIHEKASFFSTNEVLEQVTKSPLNAKYFKEYITNRYL